MILPDFLILPTTRKQHKYHRNHSLIDYAATLFDIHPPVSCFAFYMFVFLRSVYYTLN